MSNYPIYNDSNNLEQNPNNYRSTYVLTKDTVIWGVYQPGFYGFFGSGTQSSTNWSLESVGSSLILQWGDNKYTYNPTFKDNLYVFKLYWDSGLYIDTGFERTQLISDAILKDNPTYWGSIGDIFSYNSPYEIKVFNSSQTDIWEERFRRYLYNKYNKNYYPTLLQYNFIRGQEASFDAIISGNDDMGILVEYGGNNFYYTQSYVQLSMPNYSTVSYNNNYQIPSSNGVQSWAAIPNGFSSTCRIECTIYNFSQTANDPSIVGNYGNDNYINGIYDNGGVAYYALRFGTTYYTGALEPEVNLIEKNSFIYRYTRSQDASTADIHILDVITGEVICQKENIATTGDIDYELLFGTYQGSIKRKFAADFEDLKIYLYEDNKLVLKHWWPLHNTGDDIAWDIVGNNHGVWQNVVWVWTNYSYDNIWGNGEYNYWDVDRKLTGGWTQSTTIANSTDKWQFEWEIYKLHEGSNTDYFFNTFPLFSNYVELAELNGTVSWTTLDFSGTTENNMYLTKDKSFTINKGLVDNSMIPFNLKITHDGHNNLTYTVQDTFTNVLSVSDASVTFDELDKVVGGFEGSVKKAVFNNYSQSQTITFVEDFDIKRGYVWDETENNYLHYSNQPGGQLGDTALSGEILNWDDLGSDEIKFNFYLANYTYSNTIKHILSNGDNFIGWYNKQPVVKLGTLSFYGNDIDFSEYYNNEWRFNRTTGENVDVIVKNFNDDVLLGYYTFSNVRWIGTSSNSFNHMFGFTQSYFDGTFVYSEKYKNNHLVNKWINLGESNTVYDPINANHLTIENSNNYHILQSYWGWSKESSRLENMTNGTYSINTPFGESLFRYDENYDQFHSQTGEYELVPYSGNIYSFKGAYNYGYSVNAGEYIKLNTQIRALENNGDFFEMKFAELSDKIGGLVNVLFSDYLGNTYLYLREENVNSRFFLGGTRFNIGSIPYLISNLRKVKLIRNANNNITFHFYYVGGLYSVLNVVPHSGSNNLDTYPFYVDALLSVNGFSGEGGIIYELNNNGTIYNVENGLLDIDESESNYQIKPIPADVINNPSRDIYGFTLSTPYHNLFEIEKVDNREFRYKYAESVSSLSLSTGTPFVLHLLNDTDLQNTINWQIGEKYRIRFIYSGVYKYYGNDQLTIKIHGLPNGTSFDYTMFLWNENKITDTVSSDVGIIALNYLWKAFDIQEASVDFIIPDNYTGDNIWIEFDTNDITYYHDLKAYMSIKDLEVLHIPKTNSWTRVNDDETYNRVYPPITTIESKYLPLRYKNYNENNGYAYKQNSELTTINKVPTNVGNYNSWAYYTGRPYDYITVKSLKPWNVVTVSYFYDTNDTSYYSYLENNYHDYRFNYKTDEMGLIVEYDAFNPLSYPGSGNIWYDLKRDIDLTSGDNFNYNVSKYIELSNDYFQSDKEYPILNFQYYNKFTVEAYVYVNENSSTGYIVTNRSLRDQGQWYSGWGLFQLNGTIEFSIGGNPGATFSWRRGTISTSDFNTYVYQQWAHIVGVCDGDRMYIYINGVDRTDSFGDDLNPLPEINYALDFFPLTIGMSPSDGNPGGHFLTGNVSTVKIYNRALTQAEIIQKYNEVSGRY